MREEQKLNESIRAHGAPDSAEIFDELARKYPQYVATPQPKSVRYNKRKMTAVFSIAAAAFACAAIVVPCAVLLPKKGGGAAGTTDRYCSEDMYSAECVDYTLDDYIAANNLNLLNFDASGVAVDHSLTVFRLNDSGEVIGLEENSVYLDIDEERILYVTPVNIYITEYDYRFQNIKGTENIAGHSVHWARDIDDVYCYFEHDGYRYSVCVIGGEDEERLFELVAELLD